MSKLMLNVFAAFMAVTASVPSFANMTDWPTWAEKSNTISLAMSKGQTLRLNNQVIDCIYLEPASSWQKQGRAFLGTLTKAGTIKLVSDSSEFHISRVKGVPAFRIEMAQQSLFIDSNLQVFFRSAAESSEPVKAGEAKLLISSTQVQLEVPEKILALNTDSFNNPEVSDEYVLLAKPITIKGVSVSIMYFEQFRSSYPGSEVHFGNKDKSGIWKKSRVSLPWRYQRDGTVLIGEVGENKYMTIGKDLKLAGANVESPTELSRVYLINEKVTYKPYPIQ